MSKCEQCIIRQLNSLKALKKEELKSISDSKITKTVKKGGAIFEEGENLHGVFCVRKGHTKLSKLSPNGKDQIVKIAKKGDILGQRSIITQEKTNLSAIALDDTEVCFIPKNLIQNYISNNPDFTKNLLLTMAQDLKEADNVIVTISQKAVKQRIAEALLYLQTNFGEDEDGFLIVNLSREDLSNIVGTATESCIRILSEFKKKKLIATEGKRIKLLDINTLKNLVEGF